MLLLAGTCPKGGTEYTAQLLTAAGLPCRRERVCQGGFDSLFPTDRPADASWFAIPWFPVFAGVKLLVARAPLNTVRSQYHAMRFLDDGQLNNKDGAWLVRRYPELIAEQGLARYARFWLRWMEWGLEQCDLVWGLPINTEDVARLQAHLDRMSLDTPTLDTGALDRVSPDTNTGRGEWGGATTPWHDVTCNDDLMGELFGMSKRLGVELFEED